MTPEELAATPEWSVVTRSSEEDALLLHQVTLAHAFAAVDEALREFVNQAWKLDALSDLVPSGLVVPQICVRGKHRASDVAEDLTASPWRRDLVLVWGGAPPAHEFAIGIGWSLDPKGFDESLADPVATPFSSLSAALCADVAALIPEGVRTRRRKRRPRAEPLALTAEREAEILALVGIGAWKVARHVGVGRAAYPHARIFALGGGATFDAAFEVLEAMPDVRLVSVQNERGRGYFTMTFSVRKGDERCGQLHLCDEPAAGGILLCLESATASELTRWNAYVAQELPILDDGALLDAVERAEPDASAPWFAASLALLRGREAFVARVANARRAARLSAENACDVLVAAGAIGVAALEHESLSVRPAPFDGLLRLVRDWRVLSSKVTPEVKASLRGLDSLRPEVRRRATLELATVAPLVLAPLEEAERRESDKPTRALLRAVVTLVALTRS